MQQLPSSKPAFSTETIRGHSTASTSSYTINSSTSVEDQAKLLPWFHCYREMPQGSLSLFEIEALVARRMELLATIDTLLNSPTSTSTADVITKVKDMLLEEKRLYNKRRSSSTTANLSKEGASRADDHKASFCFAPHEDLVSHLFCRYAFCMTEQWHKWFLRTEEILMKARMEQFVANDSALIHHLLDANDIPNLPLDENDIRKLELFVNVEKSATGATVASPDPSKYVKVQFKFVSKLVKSRQVLCRGGYALVDHRRIMEVFTTHYRDQLAIGLNKAKRIRLNLPSSSSASLPDGNEGDRLTIVSSLDAFMKRFIADPEIKTTSKEGAIKASDVPHLAKTHMPLCMRHIDSHLRKQGHVKHHGRFMYQLFLKGIGLTLEDSMQLFSQLMTVKGGGLEAFSKSAYGYNIRHNYGKEGKKTSYTSLSCNTIVSMQPGTDQYDCHGCPFRFTDEIALRRSLAIETPSPHVATGTTTTRLRADQIDEIVDDAKGKHYTRACYKHFLATHEGARRDTLFRSPLEYFSVGLDTVEEQLKLQQQKQAQPSSVVRSAEAGKRSMLSPTLKEDVKRPKTEN